MNISPKMQLTGCLGSLVNIGALASGVYQGLADARGMPMDPNMKAIIRYSPLAISGILGIAANRIARNDGTLEEAINNAPPQLSYEEAKGCTSGCATVMYPAIAVGMTAGFEWLGYAIGHAIGK